MSVGELTDKLALTASLQFVTCKDKLVPVRVFDSTGKLLPLIFSATNVATISPVINVDFFLYITLSDSPLHSTNAEITCSPSSPFLL